MEPLATSDQHVSFWRAHTSSSVLVAVAGGAIVVVTALVWLDGGVTSPLALLYVLVLVHGVVAFPVRGAVLMTATVLSAYATVATLTGAPRAVTTAGLLAIAAISGVAGIGARGHLGVQEQQTAIQRALQQQVHTDGLTGALNHQGLHERAGALMAAADRNQPMAALAVDIDGFKQLNDTRGHHVGDEVLRDLVAVLREVCRVDDLIGRPGGDEFVVMLPGVPMAVAHGAAERVHARLADNAAPVTVSIGVGWAPSPLPVVVLLQRADEALYAAKAAGRACTRLSDPGLTPTA